MKEGHKVTLKCEVNLDSFRSAHPNIIDIGLEKNITGAYKPVSVAYYDKSAHRIQSSFGPVTFEEQTFIFTRNGTITTNGVYRCFYKFGSEMKQSAKTEIVIQGNCC